MADIAGREHAGQAGLAGVGSPGLPPGPLAGVVADDIRSGEDVALWILLDPVRQPCRMGSGADQHEEGARTQAVGGVIRRVAHFDGLQAESPVHTDERGVETDADVLAFHA